MCLQQHNTFGNLENSGETPPDTKVQRVNEMEEPGAVYQTSELSGGLEFKRLRPIFFEFSSPPLAPSPASLKKPRPFLGLEPQSVHKFVHAD